jgi:hypothetical protein
MQRSTQAIVLKRTAFDSLIGGLAGTPPGSALFTNCKVKLFVGDTVPTPASVLGDFTETTAVGYSAQTVATWAGPVNAAGDKRGYAAEPIFVFGSNSPNGVNINGYFITDNGGTTLLASERFLDPVPVVESGDALYLDLFLLLPNLLTA